MKKFLAIVAVLISFAVLANVKQNQASLILNAFDGAEQLTYLTKKPDGIEYINAYPYYIVKGNFGSESKVGESFKFETTKLKMQKFLASISARKVFSENVDGIDIACFYSSKILSRTISVGGRKINFQLAQNGDKYIVGFPLILGSF